MVPKAKLAPVDGKLFAANSTEISILGSMRLGFTVQGMSLFADLLVNDEVEEITLGVDWRTENDCKWHFAEKQIEIVDERYPEKAAVSLLV